MNLRIFPIAFISILHASILQFNYINIFIIEIIPIIKLLRSVLHL